MRCATAVCLSVILAVAWPAAGREPRAAVFTTEDGVRIVGSYYPPLGHTPRPAVILLHMYRSDRSAWRPLADALGKQDYAVLAIDLRGHGDSVEPSSMSLPQRVIQRDEALFGSMYRDVLAAYAWLGQQRNVDLSRLTVVGASVGCSVAIDYAARDRSVDLVVCMTPGEDYLGLDSRKHIAEFARYGQRPILLLATEDERKACDVLGKIHRSATVRIVGKGRVHGTHMFGKIDGIEEQIVAFLDRHLEPATDRPVVAALNGKEYFAIGSKMDLGLDRTRRRVFSSAKEAEARGLQPAQGIDATELNDIRLPERRITRTTEGTMEGRTESETVRIETEQVPDNPEQEEE